MSSSIWCWTTANHIHLKKSPSLSSAFMTISWLVSLESSPVRLRSYSQHFQVPFQKPNNFRFWIHHQKLFHNCIHVYLMHKAALHKMRCKNSCSWFGKRSTLRMKTCEIYSYIIIRNSNNYTSWEWKMNPIVRQLEFYLSDFNLIKDEFTRNLLQEHKG